MFISESYESRVVVADPRSGSLYSVEPESGRVLRHETETVLAEHAGFLALPGGRVAYVDDDAGELVVLDVFSESPDWRESAVSVAIPGEHLAASEDGRFVAVTTGLGLAWQPWSDLVTLVDRRNPKCPGARAISRRIRTRPGEPGVVIARDRATGLPAVVLRHRQPGALEVIPVEAIRAADAHVPVLRGDLTELPGDGHGDAYDPVSGMIFSATSSGVHRHSLENGAFVEHDTVPWIAPGRAYFMRFCPRHRALFAVVRGHDADPTRWHTWTNHLWRYSLDTGRVSTAPIGLGLVFRLALTRDHAVIARIHPDGDETVSFRREPPAPLREEGRSALPPMRDSPEPGREPWDGADRRAIAADPAGALFAVTRGGHGELHILNAAEPGTTLRTLRLPTPLREGGHLTWLRAGDGSNADRVGR